LRLFRLPPSSTLFPYTTLFRSRHLLKRCLDRDVRRRLRDIGEARVQIDSCLANAGAATEPAVATSPRRIAIGASIGVAVLLVARSEEHTSELQSRVDLVCRLLL